MHPTTTTTLLLLATTAAGSAIEPRRIYCTTPVVCDCYAYYEIPGGWSGAFTTSKRVVSKTDDGWGLDFTDTSGHHCAVDITSGACAPCDKWLSDKKITGPTYCATAYIFDHLSCTTPGANKPPGTG